MKAVVLSAVPPSERSLGLLAGTLDAELAKAGFETVRFFELAETKLAFCQGEFDCWVKTPGRCRAHDAETDIVQAVHDADALVFFGPLTFGGHGYALKRAIDRLICLLEPFFVKRASLTHHAIRYDKAPRLFSVAWSERATSEEAATFVELNDANAINYLAPACGAVVIDTKRPATWAVSLRGMLENPTLPGATIHGRAPLRETLISRALPDAATASPVSVQSAALLVGSPKAKGTSASEPMARALAQRLGNAGVTTDLHFATEFVHETERTARTAAALASHDLLILVTPLYVDAFPSVTTHALELIARARGTHGRPASFVLVINCGFPEPEHNRTALSIARHFAEQAGYAFGGGLPLGGGGILTPDRKLDEPHGPVAHIVRALDLATPELVRFGRLPASAIEATIRPALPEWLYALFGDLGWRWRARQNGLTQRELHARPHDLVQVSKKEQRDV
jgi:multimeric flavodoxin WrbA